MIEAIEGVCNFTVHVKPPVADEVLLVEDGAIGAEEGVVCQRGSDGVLVNTDVEHLAVTLQLTDGSQTYSFYNKTTISTS